MTFGTAAVAAAILLDVLGAVFLSIAAGYVLLGLHRWLTGRGFAPWPASAIASATAFVIAILLFVPFGIVLYVRIGAIVNLLAALPPTLDVEPFGYTVAVETAQLRAMVVPELTQIGLSMARSLPVLASKLFLFGFVVFAILHRRTDLRRATYAAVPPEFHELVGAYDRRIAATLYDLYVANVAVAVVVYVAALALLLALGYRLPFTLALIAGLLRFFPVVNPGLLIVGLAGVHLLRGELVPAAVVVVLGGALLVVIPEWIHRSYLRHETDIPQALYFVGFVGGGLTAGVVGLVAGPLVLVVLVESIELLAAERRP